MHALARFTRSTLALALVPFLSVLLPTLAFAQALAAPAPAAGGTSIMGWVLNGLYSLLILAVGWAVVKFSGFLDAKASASTAAALVNRIWIKAQAVVAKVEARIRPDVQKALADGSLTPEEGKALAAEALAIFKEVAAEEIGDLPKVLGLGDDSALGHFLEGMLERAVAQAKAPAGAPPAPLPVTPPFPPAIAKVVDPLLTKPTAPGGGRP